MNSLMEERHAEAHRQELIRTIQQYHLQDEALRVRKAKPGWFSSLLHVAGHWLIANGEKMAGRYEPHRRDCQPSRQSYAH